MSQENVHTLHALVAFWNAGERSLDAVAEHLDPAIELESPLSSVSGVPYRGHAGIEQWTRDIDEQFSAWRVSIEESRDLGGAAIVIGRVTGTGRGSGIAIEFPAAVVASFVSDGIIASVRIFQDVEEALKAAATAG